MKYIILTLALVMVGCTSKDDTRQLKHDLRFTTEQLETCQNQLSFYRGNSNQNTDPNDSYTSEPEKPAEPEYEEVEYAQINGKGAKCYEREVEACGMTFSECSDGLVYRCMKDVVYKIGTEKKLVE